MMYPLPSLFLAFSHLSFPPNSILLYFPSEKSRLPKLRVKDAIRLGINPHIKTRQGNSVESHEVAKESETPHLIRNLTVTSSYKLQYVCRGPSTDLWDMLSLWW